MGRVQEYLDLVRRARQAPGCSDFAITADPLEPDRVNNFECWESEEALEAWRKVANAPELPGVEMRDVDVWKHDVERTVPGHGVTMLRVTPECR